MTTTYSGILLDKGGAVFNFNNPEFNVGGAQTNDQIWGNLVTAVNTTGGGRIYIPQGTYAFDSPITIPNNVTIEGAGIGSTVLTFETATGVFTKASMVGSGSSTKLTPTYTVAANPQQGSVTLSFIASVPSIGPGSLLILHDPANSSFSPFATWYQAGEYVQVASASGGTLTLTQPLRASYSTSSLDVYLVAPLCVSLQSFTLIAHGRIANTKGDELDGIVLNLGYRSSIRDVAVDGAYRAQVAIERSFRCSVSGLWTFEHRPDDAVHNDGLDYGLAIGCSQEISVVDCHLTAKRHGLTSGAAFSDGIQIPVRDLNVTGGIVSGHSDVSAGFNLHGNCEDVLVTGVTLPNGMNFGGDRVTVRGCQIQCTRAGWGIGGYELIGLGQTIEDNVLRTLTDYDPLTERGTIDIQDTAQLTRDGQLVLRNNRIITGTHTAIGVHLKIPAGTLSDGWLRALDAIVDGLSYESEATAASNVTAIRIDVGAYRYLRGLTIRQLVSRRGGVSLTGVYAQHCLLDGIRIDDASAEGIKYDVNPQSLTGRLELVEVLGCSVVGAAGVGVFVKGTTAANTTALVHHNVLINCGGGLSSGSAQKASLYVENANLALIESNVLGSYTGSQSYSYSVNAVATLSERFNTQVGSSVLPSNEVTSPTTRVPTTSSKLTVNGSMASDVTALFVNSATSGYGVYIQNGNDGNYALKVVDAAGANARHYLQGDGAAFLSQGTSARGVICASAALATTSTIGFLYVPTTAGTPTGTPVARAGTVPLVFDTSANKLWMYNGGWKSVTLT